MSELIITERSDIVAIADAVRSRTGSTEEMTLSGIVDGINSISGTDVVIDATLTQEGQAADAKAVGDALANLKIISPDGTEWVIVVSNDGILSAVTKQDQYDIFVIGGQSNVVGYGTPMLATDVFPDGTYQYTQSGTVEKLETYPLNHIEAYANQIGFQHTFLDAYIADGKLGTGRKILLIPCGHPGTSFVSGRWKEGGDLHTAMLNRIAAVKNLVGRNGVFKAVLWHQGESDLIEGNTVANYKAQLGTLIDNTRAITGNIPFVMGEWQQDWLATYGDRGIQMQAVLSDIAEEKENCYLVSADGLTGDSKNGTIHFSAEAQRMFGERYYEGYKSVVNGDVDEPEPESDALAETFDTLCLRASNVCEDTWFDTSGNGHNAILYNFGGTNGSGRNDDKLAFDGIDDYCYIPAEVFDFGSNDFTLQVIGRYESNNSVMISQSNMRHTDSTIQMFYVAPHVCFHVYLDDGTQIDKTSDVLLGQDYSFAIVRSGEYITLYLNDFAFHTQNIGMSAIRSSVSHIALGKWGEENAMKFKGEIKFVGVASKAMTMNELSEVANVFGVSSDSTISGNLLVDTGFNATSNDFNWTDGIIPVMQMARYDAVANTTLFSGVTLSEIVVSGNFSAGTLTIGTVDLRTLGETCELQNMTEVTVQDDGVIIFDDGFTIPDNHTLAMGAVNDTARLCFATGATSENVMFTKNVWLEGQNSVIRLAASFYKK